MFYNTLNEIFPHFSQNFHECFVILVHFRKDVFAKSEKKNLQYFRE
jgi:hypothetical protein